MSLKEISGPFSLLTATREQLLPHAPSMMFFLTTDLEETGQAAVD